MESKPILYPYQQRWVADKSRFKIGMWSRQTGKSFATALEAVLDAVENRSLWVLLSRGERQSRELMDKVHLHCRFLGAAMDAVESNWTSDTTIKLMECRFSGGGRVIGLPANPDTARGFSGNVILDEFAFHADSRKIWTALYPSITRGYKIRIISTPNGKSGMFYDLWTADNGYSKHRVNIHDAVAQGLPLSVEELKAGIADPDAWAQEYECQFLDEATAFLTYDLINNAESDQAGKSECPGPGPFYVGNDIGRRRDLWVAWVNQLVGDVLWTREICILRGATFSAQDQEMDRIMAQYHPMRLCMDQTGMGEKPVEDAKKRYGEYTVEGVVFSGPSKQEIAMQFRKRFEDRQIRIPIDHQLRDDLHSVKKIVTASGNIRFDADRSGDGHADRFWAGALSAHAASQSIVQPYRYFPVHAGDMADLSRDVRATAGFGRHAGCF